MKISRISLIVIKVILDYDELEEFDVDIDELDRKNPQTTGLLMNIINKINEQIGLNLSNEKLFIEAFECSDGTCVMYISIIEEENNKNKSPSPIICDFTDEKTLSNLCFQLFPQCKNAIIESQLYRNESVYRLIVYTNKNYENKVINTLLEFGKISGLTELETAYTKEYYDCIFSKFAVENLSS